MATPVLPESIFFDKVIRSIERAERSSVSQYFLLVRILMVHQKKNATEKEKSDSHRIIQENLALAVTPTWHIPKTSMVDQKVSLRPICYMLVLASTKAEGIIKIDTCKEWSKIMHAWQVNSP